MSRRPGVEVVGRHPLVGCEIHPSRVGRGRDLVHVRGIRVGHAARLREERRGPAGALVDVVPAAVGVVARHLLRGLEDGSRAVVRDRVDERVTRIRVRDAARLGDERGVPAGALVRVEEPAVAVVRRHLLGGVEDDPGPVRGHGGVEDAGRVRVGDAVGLRDERRGAARAHVHVVAVRVGVVGRELLVTREDDDAAVGARALECRVGAVRVCDPARSGDEGGRPAGPLVDVEQPAVAVVGSHLLTGLEEHATAVGGRPVEERVVVARVGDAGGLRHQDRRPGREVVDVLLPGVVVIGGERRRGLNEDATAVRAEGDAAYVAVVRPAARRRCAQQLHVRGRDGGGPAAQPERRREQQDRQRAREGPPSVADSNFTEPTLNGWKQPTQG